MATAIIIGIIIALCIIAVKSYLKKLAHGCCGAGGDTERASAHKTDISGCKYKYTVHIGGMSCKNCAAKIEQSFNGQGIYARADHKSGIAEIYSETPVSEFVVRSTVVGLGYDIERIDKNAL